MDVFKDFKKNVDIQNINDKIKSVDKIVEEKEFEKVPFGLYRVRVENMELRETKTLPHRPMLSIWFRIIEGEHAGQMLFYNQQLYTKTGNYKELFLTFCNDMLRSLQSGVEVFYDNDEQYSKLIKIIDQEIYDEKEYMLRFFVNDKGFDVFHVVDVINIEKPKTREEIINEQVAEIFPELFELKNVLNEDNDSQAIKDFFEEGI